MNYIYDIFLNYNDLAYEVFEWNKEDKISHIRKIPLIVISSLDLYNLINKKIIIDSSFLTKIYRKTEVFSKRDNYYLDYSFLATDKNEIIAFKLDKNGLIKQYSKLLVEEEIEVLNYSESLSYQSIEYKIISSKKLEHFKTRNENKIKKFIYEEIKKIENDSDKLKFLYLECFGKIKNRNLLNIIYQQLAKNWENVYIKIYDFLKIMAVKR